MQSANAGRGSTSIPSCPTGVALFAASAIARLPAFQAPFLVEAKAFVAERSPRSCDLPRCTSLRCGVERRADARCQNDEHENPHNDHGSHGGDRPSRCLYSTVEDNVRC